MFHIHKWKYGKPYERTYTLVDMWSYMKLPGVYADVLQDKTCEICGKVKTKKVRR